MPVLCTFYFFRLLHSIRQSQSGLGLHTATSLDEGMRRFRTFVLVISFLACGVFLIQLCEPCFAAENSHSRGARLQFTRTFGCSPTRASSTRRTIQTSTTTSMAIQSLKVRSCVAGNSRLMIVCVGAAAVTIAIVTWLTYVPVLVAPPSSRASIFGGELHSTPSRRCGARCCTRATVVCCLALRLFRMGGADDAGNNTNNSRGDAPSGAGGSRDSKTEFVRAKSSTASGSSPTQAQAQTQQRGSTRLSARQAKLAPAPLALDDAGDDDDDNPRDANRKESASSKHAENAASGPAALVEVVADSAAQAAAFPPSVDVSLAALPASASTGPVEPNSPTSPTTSAETALLDSRRDSA